MALMITDDCVGCGACVDECPNEAISLAADGAIYAIAPERCTECVGFHARPQCAEVCPADACVIDPSRIEDEATLLARARARHPDRAERIAATPATSRFRGGR